MSDEKSGRRRAFGWMAFLAFSPVCLGVVLWAALGMNGSYPTVAPPVPPGWQAVPGIYASFSAPKDWSLQSAMSDANGDIYYSGPGGSAGESVTQASSPPRPGRTIPAVVATYLGGSYAVTSVQPLALNKATVAWHYRFRLAGGGTALGVLAWVRPTQSVVWLVASPATSTTERLLATLTLAT